jgi:hypothetical protein
MATYGSRWAAEEDFVASTASTAVAPLLDRTAVEDTAPQAMDELTGMLLSPKRTTKQSASAYAPDLCRALKSVVKVRAAGRGNRHAQSRAWCGGRSGGWCVLQRYGSRRGGCPCACGGRAGRQHVFPGGSCAP